MESAPGPWPTLEGYRRRPIGSRPLRRPRRFRDQRHTLIAQASKETSKNRRHARRGGGDKQGRGTLKVQVATRS